MAMITFMSDSGGQDHYVAAVKARVFSQDPEARLIDISHQIKAYDIAHAAFVLKAVFKDFPEGTVHIISVNAQHRRKTRHVAVSLEGHFFVGPDNGIITLLTDGQPQEIVDISATEETTFPEKELYAKAAVHLSQGKNIKDLGEELPTLTEVIGRQVKVSENRLIGNVIHVDHYGNLITNISQELFETNKMSRDFEVSFGREKADRISHGYFDVEEGDCVLFFNSLNYLEIAINKGRAAQLLGLRYDSPIIITFK